MCACVYLANTLTTPATEAASRKVTPQLGKRKAYSEEAGSAALHVCMGCRAMASEFCVARLISLSDEASEVEFFLLLRASNMPMNCLVFAYTSLKRCFQSTLLFPYYLDITFRHPARRRSHLRTWITVLLRVTVAHMPWQALRCVCRPHVIITFPGCWGKSGDMLMGMCTIPRGLGAGFHVSKEHGQQLSRSVTPLHTLIRTVAVVIIVDLLHEVRTKIT